MEFERATLLQNKCRYTEKSTEKDRHNSQFFRFDFSKDKYPSASLWRNFYGSATYADEWGCEKSATVLLSPIQRYYQHFKLKGLPDFFRFIYDLTQDYEECIQLSGNTKLKRLMNAPVLFSPIFLKEYIGSVTFNALSDKQKQEVRAKSQPHLWVERGCADFLIAFRDDNNILDKAYISRVKRIFSKEEKCCNYDTLSADELFITKINSGKIILNKEKSAPLRDLDI